MLNHRFWKTLGLLAIGGLTGCGAGSSNPKTFPVAGTVTQAGKPLEGAQVILVPKDKSGESATATTDASGKFAMSTYQAKDGARPGDYAVKVSKFDKPPAPKSEGVVNLSYEEEQKLYKPDGKPLAPPKNLLPKKYESELTSGLSHTVTTSATILDIEISGK